MTSVRDPRRRWQVGSSLMLLVIVVAGGVTVTDPPLWGQILGVVAILVLVAVASALMRSKTGAWRPSDDRTDGR